MIRNISGPQSCCPHGRQHHLLLQTGFGTLIMAFGWPWNQPTYGVTRNFDSPRFTLALLICGMIWTAMVTVLSIATVGYEYKSVRTANFNGTETLWYEKLLGLTPWKPQTKICESARIHPSESTI